MNNPRVQLDQRGFCLIRHAVSEIAEADLLRIAETASIRDVSHPRSKQPFAARALLLRAPTLRGLLATSGLDNIARRVLGHSAFPVDAIFFDKHPTRTGLYQPIKTE